MKLMKNKIVVHVDSELEELVPSYLKNLQKSAQEIKEALTKKDMSQCARLGHNMKGSGGSYGFDFVSEIGREIEEAAKAEGAAKIKHCTQRLEDYLVKVDVQFDAA